MTLRKTLLYIGAVDTKYRKFSYDIKDAGYTIIQLPDCKTLMQMMDNLDVFIIIVNRESCSQENIQAYMEKTKTYCEEHKISLVEINASITSVIHHHWD